MLTNLFHILLHKKLSFPLRISSVNLTVSGDGLVILLYSNSMAEMVHYPVISVLMTASQRTFCFCYGS